MTYVTGQPIIFVGCGQVRIIHSFGKQPKAKPALPSGLPSKPSVPSPSSSQSSPNNPPHPMPTFAFDTEWLAISRALHPYLSLQRSEIPFPNDEALKEMVKKEMEWMRSNMEAVKDGKNVRVEDIQKFVMTAVGSSGGSGGRGGGNIPCEYLWFA